MNKLLFSLLTFALFTGCYRVSDKIQPKIDYQIQDNGSAVSKTLDGLNLGIGYQF